MKQFLYFIIAFFIFYICGCFMGASFNIGDWDKPLRIILGIFTLFVELILMIVFYQERK